MEEVYIDYNLEKYKNIFNENDKNFLDIREMTYHHNTGNGVWLPSKEIALKWLDEHLLIIKQLNHYIETYSSKKIEQINYDIDEAFNNGWGNRYKYEVTKSKEIKEAKEAKEAKRLKSIKSGFIYFLSNNNGKIKIGMTTNLTKRISSLSSFFPDNPTLIHSIKTHDIYKAEKYFHEKYNKYRLNGEWFKLPLEEIDIVKSIEIWED